jgi:hypothetical protein
VTQPGFEPCTAKIQVTGIASKATPWFSKIGFKLSTCSSTGFEHDDSTLNSHYNREQSTTNFTENQCKQNYHYQRDMDSD